MSDAASAERRREDARVNHRALPDDVERERGPRLTVQAKAAIKRQLQLMVASRRSGGMTWLIQECLAMPDAHGGAMQRLVEAIEDEHGRAWRAVVTHWHQRLNFCQLGGLPAAAELTSVKARAVELRRQLGGTEQAAAVEWQAVAEAAARTAKSASKGGKRQQRPPAVGRRQAVHPNVVDERTIPPPEAPGIKEWIPPRVPIERQVDALIPRRTEPYEPTKYNQRRQLRNMQSWEVGRVLEYLGVTEAYFTVGSMYKAVLKWRRTGGVGLPPVDIMARQCHTDVMMALVTSETGHMWSVRDLAPLDGYQLAVSVGMPWLGEAFVELVAMGLTESRLRAMVGQATHDDAMGVVVPRALQRLATRSTSSSAARRGWDQDVARTVGAIASGMGLTALQVARRISGRIRWMADSCPFAGPAGEQMALFEGHEPEMFKEAEDPRLASAAYGTAVEVGSLCCAPFSSAGTGELTEAAFRELRSVIIGMAARRPRLAIYENSDGLWRDAEIRGRVEHILNSCTGYEWESMLVSPHKHAGVGFQRRRVFYVGVRRDFLYVQKEEEAEATAGAVGARTGVRPATARSGETECSPRTSARTVEVAGRSVSSGPIAIPAGAVDSGGRGGRGGATGSAEGARGPFCTRGTAHWDRRCVTHEGWDLRDFQPWVVEQLMREDGEKYGGIRGAGEQESTQRASGSRQRRSEQTEDGAAWQQGVRRSGRVTRETISYAAVQAAEVAMEAARRRARTAQAMKSCLQPKEMPVLLTDRGKRARLDDEERREQTERRRGREEAHKEVDRMREAGRLNGAVPELAWRRVGLLSREAVAQVAYPQRGRRALAEET